VDVEGDTLIDAAGTRHARAQAGAQADARIACLVPSITELICALGLAPQLVARTGFCIHPKALVADIPKVGGTKDVDMARLRSLAPTHVVLNMDENTRPIAEALAQFVPHLIVTHPNAPEDNPALYRLIGGVFGRESEAQQLCARFEKALAGTRAAASQFPPERVLYLIWKDPWMSVAADTYIARTLATVGWTTVPRESGGKLGAARYPQVDLAEAAREADLVLLSTEPYMFRERHAHELREQMPGKRVELIDGEMTSWYGSRVIEGLKYLPRLRRQLQSRKAA
jgi:ABC-type Fe3+-hydroxamate transport system substrate-binding protein